MTGRLIDEMERFEKHTRMGKTPTYSATQGHDDLMMASIWALYVLKIDIIENYYEVKQFATDKLGNQQPLFITSTEYISSSDNELHQFILDLDNKFKNNNNSYELSMNQLEQSIQQSQKELMEHFKLHSNDIEIQDFNNYSEHSDEDFQFGRIYYLKSSCFTSFQSNTTNNCQHNICYKYKTCTGKSESTNNQSSNSQTNKRNQQNAKTFKTANPKFFFKTTSKTSNASEKHHDRNCQRFVHINYPIYYFIWFIL